MPPSNTLADARINTMYGISILFGAIAVIVSAYAFFLLEHILIIYPAAHILPLVVAVEISLLIPIWIFLLFGYLKGKSAILPLALVLLSLWLIPQFTFILNVEADYRALEDDYMTFVSDGFRAGESNSPIAWNISKKYLESFSSSGNNIRNPVPVRSVFPENGVYGFHLLLHHYLFNMDGLERLITADGRGNCSEYAGAIAYLANRTLEVPSRFVIMYGYDHKFAEIKTEEGWLILDPIKTTPESPVKAEDYAEYLLNSNPLVYEELTGISSTDGVSLLLVHGFKEV
ncbi:MAG: transglutaminase domain-containing protein [Methanomicrobiaceae archaeon]|nr:transglutaminase domain-containing protein [Methanomicrobiaceae archaeon]